MSTPLPSIGDKNANIIAVVQYAVLALVAVRFVPVGDMDNVVALLTNIAVGVMSGVTLWHLWRDPKTPPVEPKTGDNPQRQLVLDFRFPSKEKPNG